MSADTKNILRYVRAQVGDEGPVYAAICSVLTDDRFGHWSGSASPSHHHYGEGGLARHVFEMAVMCHGMCNANKNIVDLTNTARPIKVQVLVAGIIFHDVGKFNDYEQDDLGVWKKTKHARHIHHISGSAFMWKDACREHKIPDDVAEDVTHCILSHHGCRKFGSPVAPNTVEAWLLHTLDTTSARMDECFKGIDFLTH